MNYTYSKFKRGIEQTITERIVSIEYWNGVPHAATTTEPDTYLGQSNYDFDLYGDDKDRLMFYESGGGPNDLKYEIHAVSKGCQLWIDPEFRDRAVLTLVNVTLLDEPVQLSPETANPFEFGYQVGDISYCAKCELYYDEEYCPDHDCEFTEGAEEEWAARQQSVNQEDDE